jgi:CDP-paratose 2-epimerase
MKLLITGICGFVGSILARAWIESGGAEVIGLDNLSRPGSERNRRLLSDLGVRVIHGDIRCSSDVDALPPVDVVIDGAANPSVLAGIDFGSNARQVVEHNLIGTLNLLEYCRRSRCTFVMLSTSRVYGIRALRNIALRETETRFELAQEAVELTGLALTGIAEEFSVDPPLSLYGASKRASEVMAIEYGELYEFPVWINRCGVLAGAGQFGRADQGIFAYWINAWLRGVPLCYLGFRGSGRQVRDCLHPKDLFLLIDQQLAGTSDHQDGVRHIVNVGGGTASSMSLAELSAWCANRFGVNQEVARESAPRKFDVPWLVLDSSVAERVWDWRPTVSRDAILEEIADHAERHPDWLDLSNSG